MADASGRGGRPPDRPASASTTTTTTTTTSHGPHTVTTTSTSAGPQTIVTSGSPQSTTFTHPTVTTTNSIPRRPVPSATATAQTQTQTQPVERRPSVRIRRLPSTPLLSQSQAPTEATRAGGDHGEQTNRRRSSSEPQRPQLAPYPANDLEIRRQVTATPLQTLHEEGSGATTPQFLAVPAGHPQGRQRATSNASRRPVLDRQTSHSSISARGGNAHEYNAEIIDMLDVIDPEVSTLTTLNNVQNSLFIPNLGSFYRRQPTYNLTRHSPDTSDEEIGVAQGFPEHDIPESSQRQQEGQQEAEKITHPGLGRMESTQTISSVLTGMSEGHNYAVLPHGASLPGWTSEEKAELNDHVRHLLHSRRAKFRRTMRGFSRYIRKPVGFLVTLYAFLLTFWGAAWVLFIIGWISAGGRQKYFIEICDQILTALFCVVGIGFAPWRAVDTYHMIYVAHYGHLTWRLRKKRGLPELKDHNELPELPRGGEQYEEDEPPEGIVLTHEQQQKLEHHQAKLANSHTFYKPHETSTHRAFSLRLLIAIVVLLDCHSLFQMALGGTTWGIYYKHRPKVLTAVILTCSISCNISAGITISIGDRRSRKKLVVEQMFRQEVTQEALETLGREKGLKAAGVKASKK